MSDDNDKTRIKPSILDANNDADKTRIAPRSSQSIDEITANQQARLAAQKKAMELEKRLALINAKKKAAAAQNTADDRTRVAMPKADANQPSSPNSADDKTRIQIPQEQSPSEPQQPLQNSPGRISELSDDTAQIAPEGVDKTVFQSRTASPNETDAGSNDTGRNNAAVSQSNAATNNDAAGDKTVYKVVPTDAPAPSQRDVNLSDSPLPLEPSPPPTPVDPTTMNDYSNADISGPPTNTIPPITPSPAMPASKPIEMTQEQELLKGRFSFEEVLGAGGMGVVYKAKDKLKVEAKDRDPYVAIKVLGDEFKAHPEAFIALQRESRKTQRIAHRNIVNVYDFDRDGDTVFMTMEFLDGKPLDKLIRQYKATGLPEEDAWNILEGISAGLIHAHEQKIIHSDFKPGNIFVTNGGIAKVFDFGIARAVAKAEKIEESVDDKTVFDAGNLGALTPAYASLEMLEGETPDVRDDLYALGCIAYEMFTGNHPFDRVHANDAMHKKMKVKRIPNITKRQFKVIERALAFKREDRVATASDFWKEITRKKRTNYLAAGISVALLSVIAVLGYQNYYAPKDAGVNADEIRSEIERELLISQNKGDIIELLQVPEFTPSWEKKLWQAYEILVKELTLQEPWLSEQKSVIGTAYLDHINTLITQEDFTRAREVLANAPRYIDADAILAELTTRINETEALVAKRLRTEAQEKKRVAKQQQQRAGKAKVQKEKNKAYDVALETVNKQLLCRTTINMRDIGIAIDKLRSLNIARYRKQERNLIVKLASCIKKIGHTFPERGEEFKKRALRIFPENDVIAKIKIEPKDPCDLALAGLGARGARAVCRDPLKNESADLGKGPSLVVIPAKGSMNAFAIGKYETTIDDINRFCKNNDTCDKFPGSSKNPVTHIDAATINKYLSWLGQMSKRKYRLPSKAEWVYAARANSSKVDSNRNCRLDSRGIKKGGVIITAKTGQQNPWGLINYLGNAQELVRDGRSYLALGGSFNTLIEECIVTKSETHKGNADKLTGFRVLREIDSPKK